MLVLSEYFTVEGIFMNAVVTSNNNNSQLKQFTVSLNDAMAVIQKFYESKILSFANIYLNHRSTVYGNV
jgi:hypothetical protein